MEESETAGAATWPGCATPQSHVESALDFLCHTGVDRQLGGKVALSLDMRVSWPETSGQFGSEAKQGR